MRRKGMSPEDKAAASARAKAMWAERKKKSDEPAVRTQRTVAEQTRVPDKIARERMAGENMTPLQKMQAANPAYEIVQVEIDDDVMKAHPMSPKALQSLGWRHPQGFTCDAPMVDESNPVYCLMMKPKDLLQQEKMARDPRYLIRAQEKKMSTKERLKQGSVTRIGRPMTVGQMMDSVGKMGPEETPSIDPTQLDESRLEASVAAGYDESGE